MNLFKRYLLITSILLSGLLANSPVSASQIFKFNGVLDDGDRFNLILKTGDTLTTINAPSHTNSAAGLTSPAYQFEGYSVTNIAGYWYEAEDLTTPLKIVALLPAGSIIENSPDNDPPGPDTKAHSPTDNLFNPNGAFGSSFSGVGGKFSFGGIEFKVAFPGSTFEEYQLFTDPVSLGYAGCPGSCVGVKEVPAPNTIPLVMIGLALVWSRRKLYSFCKL